MTAVGVNPVLPDPLPPNVEEETQAMFNERLPWEAEIPLDVLARAPFPKLVVSGDHSAAFEAACDILADRLRAERVAIPGWRHSVPASGAPFNRRLRAFLATT
jgi:hypothetical protein